MKICEHQWPETAYCPHCEVEKLREQLADKQREVDQARTTRREFQRLAKEKHEKDAEQLAAVTAERDELRRINNADYTEAGWNRAKEVEVERDAALARLAEVEEQLEKRSIEAKGFAHSSESWELMHAKRHEQLEASQAREVALRAALENELTENQKHGQKSERNDLTFFMVGQERRITAALSTQPPALLAVLVEVREALRLSINANKRVNDYNAAGDLDDAMPQIKAALAKLEGYVR